MEKKILKEYIDACELVRETEEQLRRIQRKKKGYAKDSVKASNPEFPYQPIHVHVEGIADHPAEPEVIRQQERVLKERRQQAEQIRQQVEAWMMSVPLRMQRIIRMRYFEGLSWQRVAEVMGRGATENSVRMEYQRFLNEK